MGLLNKFVGIVGEAIGSAAGGLTGGQSGRKSDGKKEEIRNIFDSRVNGGKLFPFAGKTDKYLPGNEYLNNALILKIARDSRLGFKP